MERCAAPHLSRCPGLQRGGGHFPFPPGRDAWQGRAALPMREPRAGREVGPGMSLRGFLGQAGAPPTVGQEPLAAHDSDSRAVAKEPHAPPRGGSPSPSPGPATLGGTRDRHWPGAPPAAGRCLCRGHWELAAGARARADRGHWLGRGTGRGRQGRQGRVGTGALQVTHPQADNARAGVGKSFSAHRGPGSARVLLRAMPRRGGAWLFFASRFPKLWAGHIPAAS